MMVSDSPSDEGNTHYMSCSIARALRVRGSFNKQLTDVHKTWKLGTRRCTRSEVRSEVVVLANIFRSELGKTGVRDVN